MNKISRLVDTSTYFSAGNLAARLGHSYSRNEIGHLMRTFDEMAATLELREKQNREAETALQESEERFRQLFDQAPVGYHELDHEGNIVRINQTELDMLGYTAQEMIGHPVWKFIIEEDLSRQSVRDKLAGITAPSGGFERTYRRKDGTILTVLIVDRLLRNKNGSITGSLSTIQDITRIKRAEAILRESEKKFYEMSITDGLTQLFNHRHFHHQLKIEIERVNRHKTPLSLLLMDVDDFKKFNDLFGHQEGDHVLLMLACVIKTSIREIDSAYRYGGEEFCVILPDTDLKDAAMVAKRINESFKKEPFAPKGKALYMTISIGAVSYKEGESTRDFINRADENMYKAKQLGKDQICIG